MSRILVLLLLLLLAPVVQAALLPRPACVARCKATLEASCFKPNGKVKGKCHLARLVRGCRHQKAVCTTSTTTTATTSSTTTSTTSTSTTSTTTTTCPQTGCQHYTMTFTNGLPSGQCGAVTDGGGMEVRALTCGGLNLGAGQSIQVEGPTPDGSTSAFLVSCAAPVGGLCTVDPSLTPPAPQTLDPDCSGVGCNFGTPLPIPNPAVSALSVCVHNTFHTASTGTLDLDTGASGQTVDLDSDIYLTGNLGQPCPRCIAGVCDRGSNKGVACVSNNTMGLTRDCPTGGVAPGFPCGIGGNGKCVDGDAHVGVLNVNLSPLTTGTVSVSTPDGIFCPGQVHAGCFAVEAQSTNALHCRTITETGAAAGAITIGQAQSGRLASVFCIGATGNGLVDSTTDLPGPGAVTLPGTFTVR